MCIRDRDYTPAEQQQIVTLKNDNKLEEAFQLLFLKQCAALGDCLKIPLKVFKLGNSRNLIFGKVIFSW